MAVMPFVDHELEDDEKWWGMSLRNAVAPIKTQSPNEPLRTLRSKFQSRQYVHRKWTESGQSVQSGQSAQSEQRVDKADHVSGHAANAHG